MTEKRFTYRYNGDCEIEWEIIDLDDDAYYGMDTTENCVKSLVELLNELFDKNEQLRKENKLMKETLSSIVFDNKNDAKLPALSSFCGRYAQTKLLRVNTDLS